MTTQDSITPTDPAPPGSSRGIPRILRRGASFIHAGAFLALAGSIIGFAGSYAFWFDLFSHFRLTYAVALGVALVLAIAFRQRKLALAWTIGFGINFAPVVPLFLPPESSAGSKALEPQAILRVQMVNVLRDNTAKKAVIDSIRTADPDLFVAVELNQEWLEALKLGLGDRWPHSIGEAREDAFGIALFSKRPFETATIFESPGSYAPSIRAEIIVDSHRVTVFGTHPFPPVTRFNQDNWIAQMDDLAGRVRGETGNVIVIGDFNTTPWSENYRRFRSMSGLVDSMQGFGPQPSWPSFVPYAGLPIDHVMVSPGIRTIKRRVGGFVGSDHFPVMAELVIPER